MIYSRFSSYARVACQCIITLFVASHDTLARLGVTNSDLALFLLVQVEINLKQDTRGTSTTDTYSTIAATGAARLHSSQPVSCGSLSKSAVEPEPVSESVVDTNDSGIYWQEPRRHNDFY